MDEIYTSGQLTRTVRLLTEKLGVRTRSDLIALLGTIDRSQGAEAWKGIGDVREDVVEALLALSDEGWYDATGLLPYEGYVPARPSRFALPVEDEEEDEVLTDDDRDSAL